VLHILSLATTFLKIEIRNTFKISSIIVFVFTTAFYHSVHNLLSSHLLSKDVKIRIYRTIILSVVLYGSETLSLTLRKEHILRVFLIRVLRIILGLKRDEVTGGWRTLHN
jgi:hypothetical protein